MSPLLAHLLWLSTPLVAGILTIVFPAWKVTTFLAGVAVGVGIGAAFGWGSVVVYTWTLAAFFIVACANVIISAAGPPDPSSRQKKLS